VVVDRLLCPLRRPLNRGFDPLLCSGEGDEIIEDHHDVAVQIVLDVDHLLRGEEVFASVDVAAKFDPRFGRFGDVAEAECLKPAAVGQKALRIGGKSVQSSEFGDRFIPRTQISMISIGEDDLGIEQIGHVGHIERFDRSYRPYGHKIGVWMVECAVVMVHARALPQVASTLNSIQNLVFSLFYRTLGL
jgi:hypothetical protein